MIIFKYRHKKKLNVTVLLPLSSLEAILPLIGAMVSIFQAGSLCRKLDVLRHRIDHMMHETSRHRKHTWPSEDFRVTWRDGMSLGVMGRVGSHHCIISGKNQLSVGTSCTMAIYKIAKNAGYSRTGKDCRKTGNPTSGSGNKKWIRKDLQNWNVNMY